MGNSKRKFSGRVKHSWRYPRPGFAEPEVTAEFTLNGNRVQGKVTVRGLGSKTFKINARNGELPSDHDLVSVGKQYIMDKVTSSIRGTKIESCQLD